MIKPWLEKGDSFIVVGPDPIKGIMYFIGDDDLQKISK